MPWPARDNKPAFSGGLNSPAVSATRGLRGNQQFASCAEVAFADVLEARSVDSPA